MTRLSCKTEKEKVDWVLINTVLNGSGYESYRATDAPDMPPYNWYEEAIMWAMGKDYFPNKSRAEIIQILKKYDKWNEFEKAYSKQ